MKFQLLKTQFVSFFHFVFDFFEGKKENHNESREWDEKYFVNCGNNLWIKKERKKEKKKWMNNKEIDHIVYLWNRLIMKVFEVRVWFDCFPWILWRKVIGQKKKKNKF